MTGENSTLTRTVAVGLALVLVASFGVGSVASLGDGSVASTAQDAEGEPTEVRIAHMSPDAPAVDVRVDNQTLFRNVEYGDVTEFAELEPGEHQVTIVTADNESTVFEGTVSLRANESYTVAAAGEVSENATEQFAPVVLRTDPPVPSENESAVRVAHFSPDAGPVDVTVADSGAVLADNVTFGNASDYLTVPSGVYEIEVRAAAEDNNGTVVATFNESLRGGTAYTAFAAGYASPGDAPVNESLDLFVGVDASRQMTNASETQRTDRAKQPEQAEETTTAPGETTTEA
ncbi:DUF4397 domain-containing protein [Halorussus gelatinilyticus]|uniref:DUF4397 domain-containing protein n=1 Tax=Halorussus gelatinilyticus TaxID=2937524 RepID=A0A8U0IG97_9EURY|nr:DUF4397 domain-containing protein [Halorussus gelatinilyticus]UPW00110.1 DUF4397 domain-containing protein [Halorussus gelatinilyticus]